MRLKRALYITHYAELYGANRSLFDLIIALRDRNYVDPLVVLAADGPFVALLKQHGITHAVIPFEPWMHKRVFSGGPHHRLLQRIRYRRASRERDRLARNAVHKIRAFAGDKGVELVHTNSSVIGVGGLVARALDVPHIWHIRELPFLHYGFSVDGGVRRYAQELRQAQAVIALSQAVVDDMRTLLPKKAPIHCIPDGMVSERSLTGKQVARRVDGVNTGFNFVLAALFHPSKGQEEAVRAFAVVHREFTGTTLHLVGGGRADGIRRVVQELGLQQAVRFHGFVDDLNGFLKDADCLLQCSKHEALGRVVVEAMAARLPVIGHASGATPELVEHEVTGLLYSGPDDLTDHMRTLITDPAFARRMGMEGHSRISGRFTVEVMTERIGKVYQEVLHEEQ